MIEFILTFLFLVVSAAIFSVIIVLTFYKGAETEKLDESPKDWTPKEACDYVTLEIPHEAKKELFNHLKNDLDTEIKIGLSYLLIAHVAEKEGECLAVVSKEEDNIEYRLLTDHLKQLQKDED